MKKLIIPMLLLLPSCTIIDIATGFGGIMYHARQLEKKSIKQNQFVINNAIVMIIFQINGVTVCNLV